MLLAMKTIDKVFFITILVVILALIVFYIVSYFINQKRKPSFVVGQNDRVVIKDGTDDESDKKDSSEEIRH